MTLWAMFQFNNWRLYKHLLNLIECFYAGIEFGFPHGLGVASSLKKQ